MRSSWPRSTTTCDANSGTHSHEVRVVLYGPTQVGKTTLILRLLGLSDETTKEAQRVLRGGRGHGKSATASVTRYRLTHHDAWSWSCGSDVIERAAQTRSGGG